MTFSAQASLRPGNRVFGLYLSLSARKPNRSKLLTCLVPEAARNWARPAQHWVRPTSFPRHYYRVSIIAQTLPIVIC
jgi:hypothetical protein